MKKLISISVMLVLLLMELHSQSCFTPVWTGNGLDQMNFYITSATVDGLNMSAGDEIGIFDGTYCVGVGVLTEELTDGAFLSFVASKDDPDTPEIDGFTEGNPIGFQLCINSGSVIVTDVQATFSPSYDELFKGSGTALVDLAGVTECTDPPSLSLASASGSTCVNSPITGAGNTFGGSATQVTITEDGAGYVSQALFTSSPFDFTYNPDAADAGKTVTITLTTDNPNGDPCYPANETYTLTVDPENTVGVASSTPTLCINTALTPITHSTTGATGIGTPTGLPGGVSANWASNTITISGTPTASGVFNYTIPLSGGCGTVSATGTITVDAQPTTSPITGNATPPCSGTGYVYSVTNTAQSDYAWTIPEGATIVSGQGSHSITVNFGTTNGNITVTETNGAGCEGTPVTLAISLQGCGLDANFEGTPQLICIGSTVTFTNTSSGTSGSTTYSWDFGAGATPATATGIGPHIVTYSTEGSYTVSLTITEGASNTETKADYIKVNPENTVGTASSTPTLCINTALTPITHSTTGATGIGTATGLPGGISANWASNTITISGTPTASGIFNYTIPLTGGCGAVSATGTITVTADMTAGAASSTPTLCINSALTPITHSTTGATGIGTVIGLPAGVGASFASNTITISGTPTAAGTFNYTIPLTGGCGAVNATGTITVTPANTVTLSSGEGTDNQTVCINSPIATITYGTTGATGATFSNFPTGLSVGWSSDVVTISGSPTASGTYNYKVTLTGGCGTVSATGTIIITPANTITLTSGAGTNIQTLCANTPISNITYSTTGATGATFSGLPSGVNGSWSSNVVTLSGTPTAAGINNYTVTLTGGCGTVTATGTITVNALPSTSVITGDATPACSGAGYVYSVTNTAGSDYAWTVPEGATIASGQGSHSIIVDFGTTNGDITVTETNSSNCTGTPKILAISLQGCGLDANFTGTPLEICIGSQVTFTNTSTGTTGSTTYSWDFGDGASPATANTIGPHTVTYSTAGSKTVSLTITEGASNTQTRSDYITVNPTNTITLSSGAGTDNQTVCMNIPITSITYGTTGAAGAVITGLPSGVTGSWSSDVVTISGTPDESGTFNYTVTLTGGCGTITANGTLTVNICSKTLSLSFIFLEGLYDGGTTMRQSYDENGPHWPAGVADHITVELHNSANYYTVAYTASDVPLSTSGAANVTIPVEYGASYYITIKHRNHIETTTASPVSFSDAVINYAFDVPSKVYGSNLKLIDHYVIYGADVNQDGFVDSGDYPDVVNDNYNYVMGYLPTDINGDGFIDSGDYPIMVNNNYNYVSVILP